jgi:hypothetical protein
MVLCVVTLRMEANSSLSETLVPWNRRKNISYPDGLLLSLQKNAGTVPCSRCLLVCFLLGNSLMSEFYMPTFWNSL